MDDGVRPAARDGRRSGRRFGAWPLVLAGAVAVALAGLLYYSVFVGLFEARIELAAAQAALPPEDRCPPPRPLGDKLARWVVGQVAHPQPALAAPLLAGGLAGAALVLRRRARLGVVLAACWLGAALSLATLLTSDQAVRWQPFLFPALCVGAAVALAAWWRRGSAGRALALAALLLLVWHGLADWVRQVAEYLH